MTKESSNSVTYGEMPQTREKSDYPTFDSSLPMFSEDPSSENVDSIANAARAMANFIQWLKKHSSWDEANNERSKNHDIASLNDYIDDIINFYIQGVYMAQSNPNMLPILHEINLNINNLLCVIYSIEDTSEELVNIIKKIKRMMPGPSWEPDESFKQYIFIGLNSGESNGEWVNSNNANKFFGLIQRLEKEGIWKIEDWRLKRYFESLAYTSTNLSLVDYDNAPTPDDETIKAYLKRKGVEVKISIIEGVDGVKVKKVKYTISEPIVPPEDFKGYSGNGFLASLGNTASDQQ